ncbi:thiamine pyrophosphate-dependent enzyme [Marinicella sp. S1101]|uniref:alpha-ketoacid dehydrogenase subunit alpha/beta n=1 Tax=Marinicella marina TaxID=2996016 RepID=UPI002260CEA8|nr:thiamine pyrophosphate-dependent enzyme [Marinicella marina]MCX7552499.1 thiamine pyrophosphate-dependent enzyme [Marinicella marina]MDJ1139375.1 thiamine pyrophosphate-dependent enzyme [Marinicella marina]
MQLFKNQDDSPSTDNTEHTFDWLKIAKDVLISRALDDLEEFDLVKQKKVLYQFSARGHDMAQIMLGQILNRKKDAVSGYYRSRPLLLSLGLPVEQFLQATMMKQGGFSNGRDIGVVFNQPNHDGPCVLPMSGGVGAQYTPVAGWAQAVEYHREHLNDTEWDEAMGLVLGGDGSVATNGFWSSLTMATTLELPMLFYIEDNGYGISVPSHFQTPGGNIVKNLASFRGIKILSGDGTNPQEAAALISQANEHIRKERKPVLLRLTVPRLNGHSAQDTQSYKSDDRIEFEKQHDPLPKLKKFLIDNNHLTANEWDKMTQEAKDHCYASYQKVDQQAFAEPTEVEQHAFEEQDDTGQPVLQAQGGIHIDNPTFPPSSTEVIAEGGRINMVTAIRKTLDFELTHNNKMLVFGEDVGAKGGVHAVTLGLQEKHGEAQVFDTSLSEEGIIGRSIGLSLAGLLPVPEIQFRKYADPAEEQLNETGSMRWRTNNRFAAPMVVRMAGGYFGCGDPWHSQCAEVKWVHAIGWQVAMPSNAEDAVGLLRYALRNNNPSIFFEHRKMLDHMWARRPYPGDQYIIPFGQGKKILNGDRLTVVSWGGMVHMCQSAIEKTGVDADLIDLRTLRPWDKEMVLESVKRTGRCLIVHEDNISAGFGAEIAAVLAKEAFFYLDAPIERLATADIGNPHDPRLMEHALPNPDSIAARIIELDQV